MCLSPVLLCAPFFFICLLFLEIFISKIIINKKTFCKIKNK
jgi:hypothetical protein